MSCMWLMWKTFNYQGHLDPFCQGHVCVNVEDHACAFPTQVSMITIRNLEYNSHLTRIQPDFEA
jgi:hypothetical protein